MTDHEKRRALAEAVVRWRGCEAYTAAEYAAEADMFAALVARGFGVPVAPADAAREKLLDAVAKAAGDYQRVIEEPVAQSQVLETALLALRRHDAAKRTADDVRVPSWLAAARRDASPHEDPAVFVRRLLERAAEEGVEL